MELRSLTDDAAVAVEDYGAMNNTAVQLPSSDDTTLVLTDDKLTVSSRHYLWIPCISNCCLFCKVRVDGE